MVSNLAIATYNMGCEEEYFNNIDRALINFSNACKIVEDNLGEQNILTQKFMQFFNLKRKVRPPRSCLCPSVQSSDVSD